MLAPAGYGKTTLVASAAAELGWQCVWYRLDQLDADPALFLHSLASAVRLRLPESHETLFQASAGPGDGAASASLMAARFAQELTLAEAEHLFLVLDDYDSVEPAGRFDEAVAALLRLLPPTVHLVVLGRRRPAFATAKLELDGGLAEITHRDLLLDSEQIARTLARQGGATLPPAAVEKLLQLTEGWAAGVVLAGKTASRVDRARLDGALGGRDLEREVFPYFADQVYEKQPAEVRQFLKVTSCLPSMTVALAEAITQSPEAGRLLEQLETEELFAFPDPDGGALRYHPLFRGFLQARMIQEEGRVAYRELQRGSAEILAAHGRIAPAVALFLALGEPQAPLAMLERLGTELLDECSDALLARWADALRPSEEADSGWAALLDGSRLFRGGHLRTAREQLELAQAQLSGDPAGRYLAHRALARHCYATGKDEEAIEHARSAVGTATGRRQQAESLAALARVLSYAGRWRELDEALAAFDACGDAHPGLVAKMASLEAHRTYIAGNVKSAHAAAERALPLAQRHASKEEAASLLNALATLSLFRGLYSESAALVVQAQQECAAHDLPKVAAEVEVTRAALLAHEGSLEDALSALDAILESQYALASPALRFEALALRGTMLRRAGRLEDAEQAYEQAHQLVELDGSSYDRLDVQLDLAFTLHLRRADPQAAAQMQHHMDEAAHSRLLFQYAKARLYLGIASRDRDRRPAEDLASPCEELVRLGHLDFLGAELSAYPEAATALVTADLDEGSLGEALGAIASQARGPAVLASLATLGDRAGLLVVEAARRLPAEQRRWLLAELRRHPSRRVRDCARSRLLSGEAGRLFPELTPREEEVLALLAAGAANRKIAEQLSLTLATVKTHVHRILAKTRMHGRLAAAVLYQQRAAADAAREHDRLPPLT